MSPSPAHALLLAILFFVSGAAALIYQVLWVRELGLLFGSTAEAAAIAIAVFFAGIAIGGAAFGAWAARLRLPLAAFGLVEIGVAATALGHFLVADAYFALYPRLYALVGANPVLETLLKALVAATILLPSAILMGGTLPLIGQHAIRAREALGRTGAALYALNTAGGATGAVAAGFVLPMALGFSGAYLLAVGLDLGVGLAAIALARRASATATAQVEQPRRKAVPLPRSVAAVAFLSGFATLAVEIVWTRAFSQVLQNSVYTYALVLATFLVALSLGAALASLLARRVREAPRAVVAALLLASAIAMAAQPFVFHHLSDGLSYLGAGRDFSAYVVEVARLATLAMLIPATVLGAVLPALLRLAESDGSPGATLGRLVAVNTTGAILGALAAGFMLLPTLGLWGSFLLVAGLYLVLAAAIAPLPARRALAWRAAAVAGAIGLVAYRPDLPTIHLAPGERLVALVEGRAATAAVVERDGAHFLRVNNFYTLGGSGALAPERNQTLVPLLAHPDPRALFFLGMGTGISAGAGLLADPERVTVCELLPEVVALAKAHFRPYVMGLFDDPRVTIHAEDGRHCLARSPATYDAIIADLFTPWKAGTGNLYTLEHYRIAASRLAPGGIYVQWIPLYQVSRAELATIANTMAQVFPELTLWRGDLFARDSILALVARNEPAPLDPTILVAQARTLSGPAGARLSDSALEAMALRFYAGNVASGLFADAPINTDDHPLIEQLSPRTHRAVAAGTASFLVGAERDALFEDLLAALPPEADPHLAALDSRQHGLVEAGRLYPLYRGLRARGLGAEAAEVYRRYRALTPFYARRPTSPAGEVGEGAAAFGVGGS